MSQPDTIPDDPQEALAQLRARRSTLKLSDPYAFFELWEGCGQDHVDEVYFKIVTRHHPDRFANLRSSEVTGLANEVFLEINALHQTLMQREITRAPSRPRPASAATPPRSPATPAAPAQGISRTRIRRPATRPTEGPTIPTPPPASDNNLFTRRPTSPNTAAPDNLFSRRPSSPHITSVPSSTPLFTRRSSSPQIAGVTPPRPAETSPRAVDQPPTPAPPPATGGASLRAPGRQSESVPGARPQGPRDAGSRFREGLRLMNAQAFDKAQAAFQQALDSQPDNKQYLAHLAWCEFLCDTSVSEQSRKKLLTVQHDPEVAGEANYFLGKIAAQAEDLQTARRHFKAAQKLDPKNVDILRELRLLKMRNADDEKSTDEARGGFFKRLFSRKKH